MKRNKTLMHCIIVAAFMFLFKYLPTFSHMTKEGMEMLGVYLGLIYGWCTIGMILPGLLAFVAIPLTAMFDMNSFLAAGMGGNIVNTSIFSVLFCFVISATKVSDTIVNKVFHTKLIQKYSWGFLFAILIGGWIMGVMAGQTVGLLILMPLITVSCKQCGYEPDGKTHAFLMIAALMSILLGSLMMPFKDTPLILLSAYSSINSEFTIDMGKYLLFALILSALIFVVYILFTTFVFRVDLKNFTQNTALRQGEKEKFNKKQKIVLGIFFAFIILVLIPGFLSGGMVKDVLGTMGVVGISCLLMAVMMLLRVDGEALFDFREAARNYPWEILMCLAACLPIAANLTNEQTGISDTIIALLNPVLGNLSPITFSIIIILMAVVLTNVLNNVPCALLLIPIVASYAPILGFNATPIVIVLIFAVHASFATPAASTAAQLLFASSGADKMQLLKAGILSLIPMFVCMVVAGLTFGQILF